jgi:hypothetical protein
MSQSNSTETILHLYRIENPRWNQILETHKDKISKEIIKGGWQLIEGKRRGFLNCLRLEDIVYGYYAQEGSLRVEQYDDRQQPKIDNQDSFERILFLIFLSEGILVVQSIRISRYLDLTGPTVRDSLFKSLEVLFRQGGLVFKGHVNFERYLKEYTKDELLEIFEAHNIVRVIVKDLLNSDVPKELKLFNPDFDADGFLKTVINEDLQLSDHVDWSGQDIQKTKIPRALVHAGSPQLIEGLDEYGESREWELSTPETIALDLNTNEIHFPEEDLNRLLALIKRKFGLFSERLRELEKRDDVSDLPLFGKQSK